MAIPGFTANASVNKISLCYRSALKDCNESEVVVTQFIGRGNCHKVCEHWLSLGGNWRQYQYCYRRCVIENLGRPTLY